MMKLIYVYSRSKTRSTIGGLIAHPTIAVQ
jgi:hypothetical protein